MPYAPARPADLRGQLFRGSAQVRAGRLTKAQLRSSAWRRLFPDVYACAFLTVDHARRARAAAGLAVPGACISGRSAAVLWGVPLAGADDDVELTVPSGCRAGSIRGIQLSRRHLPDDDVVVRGGVRVTTALRTAIDVARIGPIEEAVVAPDQLVRAGLVSLERVRGAAAGLRGPGCRSVRRAAQLADGRFIARGDFAWPDAKVVLEYDGIWHGQPQQVGRDRRRLNELIAAGWTVVFATAADLRDPAALIARLAAALTSPRYGWMRLPEA